MRWLSAWKTVLASSRRSPAEVEAFQLGALRRLLKHTQAEVPLYRRLYRSLPTGALVPASRADLGRLPTSDRALYQDAAESDSLGVSCRRSDLLADYSSGSSGQPLGVYRTSPESRLLEAFRLRAYFEYGGRLSDRRVTVGFAGRHDDWDDASPGPTPLWQRFGLLRRTVLHCGAPVAELVGRLVDLEPQVLTGYGASLARVAEGFLDAGRAPIRLRFVMTGGEDLALPMRRTIAEIFGVPVYDLYGASEFNLLAWQCRSTGLYHVCDDNVIVEILRDGEPVAQGEEGGVVVTGLHSYAMPFIRHRTGDVAVRGPERCPCGAPWSTIEELRGRSLEGVVLPNGDFRHHWAVVSPLVNVAPWLRRYRLSQERPDEVVFEVVATRPPMPEEVAAVAAAARPCLGDEVALKIVLTDELPPGSSGKHLRHRGLKP